MTEADVLRTHLDLFNGALKSRDWDQLAAIYSDDYMLIRPDGSVLSKEEVLGPATRRTGIQSDRDRRCEGSHPPGDRNSDGYKPHGDVETGQGCQISHPACRCLRDGSKQSPTCAFSERPAARLRVLLHCTRANRLEPPKASTRSASALRQKLRGRLHSSRPLVLRVGPRATRAK